MLYLAPCIIGLIIQIAFIVVESKKKYLPAVVLKGCASVVFVIIGFLCATVSDNADFARLITIGLLLGALGDILLNLRFLFEKKGQTIFLAGVAAFLAGHILYLAALITISSYLVWSLIAGLILAALLLLWIFKTLGEIKKSFKIFGILYIGIISVMTAVAAGNLISAFGSQTLLSSSLLFFIGAVLFLASDVIMILNTFGKQQKQAFARLICFFTTSVSCLLRFLYYILDSISFCLLNRQRPPHICGGRLLVSYS